MEKKISYLNRNYEDYRQALIDLSKTYYPDMSFNFDDASVGSWFIDLNAAVADELSYYVDRMYQETNIDSATKASSIYTIARNAGFKVPGPKGAMCEVAFKCVLPYKGDNASYHTPEWSYAPVIKRGTRVSSGSQSFELLADLDFSKQFNSDGVSDRLITPNRDSNKIITSFTITKLAVVTAGETNIYKKSIKNSDIKPFMEFVIPTEGVMNVESIIMKEGSSFQSNPEMSEFMQLEETNENNKNIRFFEVNSLSEPVRWGEVVNSGKVETYKYGYAVSADSDTSYCVPTYSVTKGEWKTVKHKYITEFTDNGYLKIIFGAGTEDNNNPTAATSVFAKNQLTRMVRNNNLGILPKAGCTLYVLYRSGGGVSSNLAAGAIDTITSLKVEFPYFDLSTTYLGVKGQVQNSIVVESTMESVSGKDMPTVEELKYMVKYASAAQERCVTAKDYLSRLYQMPPKYGCPFRAGVAEENNKIMLYLLGVDYNGKLDTKLPLALVNNIEDYLANYRMINDYVEIKSGKIINLRFEPYVIISKDYNVSDVVANIKNVIIDYMDINKHQMGDDIYVGDIMTQISNVGGVLNLIKLEVYNVFDDNHSSSRISQPIVYEGDCGEAKLYAQRALLDLEASDGVVYSEGDCMLEVKYDSDITVHYKER